MAQKKGICKNFENCTLADNNEIQEVDSSEFRCTECGKELHEIKSDPGGSSKRWIIIVIAAIILIGGSIVAYFGFFKSSGNPELEPVVSLSLNKDALTLDAGTCDTLIAAVTTTPDVSEANASVSFTSDNTNVAQVDNTGVVRAVAKGETTITVVASSPKGSADTAKVRVSVNEILPKSTPEPDPIPTPKQSKKNHNGTSDQGWYTWDGGYKDGKPHGKGKMRITRTYTIELKDITGSKITVYPGETINAMLDNGRLRGGDIIHKDGSSTTFVNNL